MIKSSVASTLVTFVKVARYSSLTKAAQALHLTTGAISQQLLQLEAELGFTLFERHSRGIRLTEQGRVLLGVAEKSFNDLDLVIHSLKGTLQKNEVRLKLTPSFAFKWLVPRLESFYRLYPDIQIQTFAEGALVDSEARDFDLAIDYGPTPYPRSGAELLFEEMLVPVMSPGYLNHFPAMRDFRHFAQWQKIVFLHDALPWANAGRDYEWLYWASEMGLDIPAYKGHFFNRTDMAMSAAEAGLGIAMARRALLGDELATGKLVAPFPRVAANAGYHLLIHTQDEASQIFIRWLREKVAEQEQAWLAAE